MDDMDIVTSEQIIGLISSGQKWTLLCFMQALYGTISFAYDIERKYYWDEKNVFFQLTMIQPEEDISPLPYFLVFCDKKYMKKGELFAVFNKYKINHIEIRDEGLGGSVIVPFQQNIDDNIVLNRAMKFVSYLKEDD